MHLRVPLFNVLANCRVMSGHPYIPQGVRKRRRDTANVKIFSGRTQHDDPGYLFTKHYSFKPLQLSSIKNNLFS